MKLRNILVPLLFLYAACTPGGYHKPATSGAMKGCTPAQKQMVRQMVNSCLEGGDTFNKRYCLGEGLDSMMSLVCSDPNEGMIGGNPYMND